MAFNSILGELFIGDSVNKCSIHYKDALPANLNKCTHHFCFHVLPNVLPKYWVGISFRHNLHALSGLCFLFSEVS